MFKGHYYDGKSSTAHVVTVSVEAGWLHIAGEGIDLHYSSDGVRVGERVANVPCPLFLPDGGRCDVESCRALDILFGPQQNRAYHRLIHIWENRLGYPFLALALSVFIIWWAVQYGIPLAAKHVAFSLPATTEDLLGRNSLNLLDRMVFSPSLLPEVKRLELTGKFSRMVSGLPDNGRYRLEFRESYKIGPNAFALPSGIVVITDEMVELAKNDEELIGVFAHELGHVKYRHSLRYVLQNSVTGLLIAAIMGDILSTSALAAALPTILVDAKFSREFEREADAAAAEYLKAHNISPEHLANLLARLEAQEGGKGESVSFLSSHPATKERVELMRESR